MIIDIDIKIYMSMDVTNILLSSSVSGNLFINGVQKFDAGTYLCKAANGVGQAQNKVIAVDVLGMLCYADVCFWPKVLLSPYDFWNSPLITT